MNTVILMGRLTEDPVIRENGNGKDALTICNFTLAVDRGDKDHNADFIRCTAFGARAEFIEKYFQKGQRALVTGRWQTGHYENKDKETVYINVCMVSNIEFADSKKSEERNVTDSHWQRVADYASEDDDRNDRRRR